MEGYEDRFKGKKITVIGIGVLGRGVGDIEFLAKCGAIVTATDLRSEKELGGSVEYLKKYPNITFHLDGHREEDFTSADLVLKAAGVPLDSIYIAAAKKAGVTVAMSTALVAEAAMKAGVTVIGITGTRGKSTVTHMINHVLTHAGKKVHIGGNIRGVSTLAFLPAIEPGDLLLLELDSWQLQGFGDLQISPHIAVFTNLMPDHLNYYADMDAYFDDKAKIFRHQKKGDTLVVGPTIANRVYAANPPVSPHLPEPLPLEWILHLPGEHNRENAALARCALQALGLTDKEIHDGLATFMGVEGRLQLVREVRGIQIYNDNNATTPEATVAAIRALSADRQGSNEKKNIILIMGGSDKKLDMSALWKEIQEKCKDLYFLSGTGIDRIRPEAPHVPEYKTLQEAVEAAFKSATAGDIILFSPAFASFGMFKNEYDRNDQFLSLVKKLA